MSEEGTWTKIKRAVKGFFTGAVKSAPTTILLTGAGFGISAALGHYVNPDMDFLRVGGNDAAKIGTRLFGAALIGSGVSGIAEAVKSYSTPEPHASTGITPQSGGTTTQRAPGMDLTPPPSPFPSQMQPQRNR